MTFEQYWSALELAGWFAAYGESGRAWFRESLAHYWKQGSHYAVNALGRPAYDTEWLAEREEAPQLVVESFASASDGHFQPEEIKYEHYTRGEGRSLEGWCRLSFTHAGQRVHGDFPWLGGSAEPAMLALCNEALAEAGSPYRFFETPGDQCCYVALVRPDTYEAIKERGWLSIRELPGGEYGALVE